MKDRSSQPTEREISLRREYGSPSATLQEIEILSRVRELQVAGLEYSSVNSLALICTLCGWRSLFRRRVLANQARHKFDSGK